MTPRFWLGVSVFSTLVVLLMLSVNQAHAECTTTQISPSHKSISCGNVGAVPHPPHTLTTAVVVQYGNQRPTLTQPGERYPVRVIGPESASQAYTVRSGQTYDGPPLTTRADVGVKYGPSRTEICCKSYNTTGRR